jgi:hypothetical protein
MAVHRPGRKAEAFGEQSGMKWTSHGVQMKSAPLPLRNFGPALDLEMPGYITSANPAASQLFNVVLSGNGGKSREMKIVL